MKPRSAYSIAGANKSANGKRPKRCDSAAQAETAPGTVMQSQPMIGIPGIPLKRCGVQPCGECPDAFKPCSRLPSQINANASDPMPFIVGSTTVSVML